MLVASTRTSAALMARPCRSVTVPSMVEVVCDWETLAKATKVQRKQMTARQECSDRTGFGRRLARNDLSGQRMRNLRERIPCPFSTVCTIYCKLLPVLTTLCNTRCTIRAEQICSTLRRFEHCVKSNFTPERNRRSRCNTRCMVYSGSRLLVQHLLLLI